MRGGYSMLKHPHSLRSAELRVEHPPRTDSQFVVLAGVEDGSNDRGPACRHPTVSLE